MARARNVKPSLFKNEILGVADPLCSLLFIGLWQLADREGRLEDRPMRIKAELFPYRDGIDVNAMLTWLDSQKDGDGNPEFIVRYAVGGQKYIQIINFKKHQNPHQREVASVIPPYLPKEDEAQPRHNLGTTKAMPSPADSLNPLPLTLNPIVARKRATQAPETFVIGEKLEEWLGEQGLTTTSVAEEVHHFLDYHKAKGSTFLDWDAAFRTWVRNSKKFKANGTAKGKKTVADYRRESEAAIRAGDSNTRKLTHD